MRYISALLGLTLLHQYGYWEYAIDALAAVVLGSGVFLYWLLAKSLTGTIQLQMQVGEDFDPQFTLIRKLAEAIAITVLILAGGGYAFVGMFLVPYVIVSAYAEIFAALIHYEFIELVDPEYDDEDEQ